LLGQFNYHTPAVRVQVWMKIWSKIFWQDCRGGSIFQKLVCQTESSWSRSLSWSRGSRIFLTSGKSSGCFVALESIGRCDIIYSWRCSVESDRAGSGKILHSHGQVHWNHEVESSVCLLHHDS
jgi:hypothetical protein